MRIIAWSVLSMEIHPIKNDDDHAAAVREIEKLWAAAVGAA
jgi:HTH-type transcriptional regulator/antitoxin HigA